MNNPPFTLIFYELTRRSMFDSLKAKRMIYRRCSKIKESLNFNRERLSVY